MRLWFVILATLSAGVWGYSKPKFKQFYPKYEYFFDAAAQRCQPEIRAYQLSIRTPVCDAPCACAIDCLLSNTTASIQANMASASVILGLTPAILVFVGPTVSEMATISTWSPLLGLMLVMASPAVNIQRVFSGNNVSDLIHEPVSVTYSSWHNWLRQRGKLTVYATKLTKFILVLGALVNTVENSIRLELRTVPSFRCGVVGLPIAWSLLGISVYLFAAVGVRMRGQSRTALKQPKQSHAWEVLGNSQNTIISETLLWVGSKVAIAVMIFGVAVLSSLLLIAASDAVVVLVRYLLSAGICQTVLLSELASLRIAAAQQKKPKKEEVVIHEANKTADAMA